MYNCLLIVLYFYLAFIYVYANLFIKMFSLQLQKATKETNRIKEDMKALQNDLSNADKEITVRKSQFCFIKYIQTPL